MAGFRRTASTMNVSPIMLRGLPLLCALLGLIPLNGFPESARGRFDEGPVLSLALENDFVRCTDRWYSQGARIVYLEADDDLPRWASALLEILPAVGFSPRAGRIGFEIGHSIFTPADTLSATPLPDDRPYAGWLYAGLLLQRRGRGVGNYLTIENVQLELGVIGPASFADHIQSWYHREPMPGWEKQLRDEPGVALKAGRAWLIPLPSRARRYVDLIPQGGLSAGNVDTSLRAGTTLRAGWNLPADFGIHPIESVIAPGGGRSPARPGRSWAFYLFSGVEARAVFHTAFLDGNTFRESRRVDKEPYVGEWRSGFVLAYNRVELAYTHTFRTREFETQPETHVFGAFGVKVAF